MNQPASASARITVFAHTYPGRAEQVPRVRAQLRELLADCALTDDVILCASELATNAILHSNSGTTGGTFTVRTVVAPGKHVRIEVADDGGPWATNPSDPDRAHGLDIIRALASAWGLGGDRKGRTIWARFDWPAP